MNGGEESESLLGYRYYRRTFLNRPGHHASAFIYATVSCTKADDQECASFELTIGDCYRSISLSIDAYSQEAATNSLYKLDTLIETLTEYREAFRHESELQRERERRKSPVRTITSWLR